MSGLFATVGLFGKHPSTGDFIRAGSTSELVTALDRWLAGALVAGHRELGDWDQRYIDLMPSPFLFANGGPQVLFGVLVPSADREGRAFPLALYVACDRQAIATARLAALPHEGFIGAAVGLLEQRGRFAHDELRARVSQIAPPTTETLGAALERHQRFVGSTSAAELFGELLPGRQPDHWAGAMEAVRQAAHSVGVALSPELQSYGIRCPLGHQPSAHAAFWLDLLQRAGPAGFVPNTIWNRYGMLIFCGQPSTRALAGLLCPSWQHDSLLDLAATAAGTTTTAPPPAPEASLDALLQRAP